MIISFWSWGAKNVPLLRPRPSTWLGLGGTAIFLLAGDVWWNLCLKHHLAINTGVDAHLCLTVPMKAGLFTGRKDLCITGELAGTQLVAAIVRVNSDRDCFSLIKCLSSHIA